MCIGISSHIHIGIVSGVGIVGIGKFGRVVTARSQQWSSGRGQCDSFQLDIFVYGQDTILNYSHIGLGFYITDIVIGNFWAYADQVLEQQWSVTRGQSVLSFHFSMEGKAAQ